jgi:electron transfer flavoprotein alpha subunit
MRIAVLLKQVPRFEAMGLGPDGRLQRDGLELEMNPYCRRAVAKGVELARQTAGTCAVFSLGPPAAEDVIREAVAWGADTGILVSDPAFAGSDTLATARALAAALRRFGPFDLVLTGRNSVDADTGQVGPQLAEMLGLPFLTGVRELRVDSLTVAATCEHDDGSVEAEVDLPAVLSCAERLCDPAKVAPEERAAVDRSRISVLAADDLGRGPWGHDGSATRVGPVLRTDVARLGRCLTGPLERQVQEAVDLLLERGALNAPVEVLSGRKTVAPARGVVGPAIVVIAEPERPAVTRELLGEAARLAAIVDGHVVALGPLVQPAPAQLACWGADHVVAIRGGIVEEDVAKAVSEWAERSQPWGILAPSTAWGREVAGRVAARLNAGLTGDAIALTADGGRLVCSKPAFGGSLVAAITATTEVQMATIRPGVLPVPAPRDASQPEFSVFGVVPSGRVRHLQARRDDDLNTLQHAEVVIGVGTAVAPGEYEALRSLQLLLGAELGATRKVTDRGWLPRARQIGITGRTIRPRLYIAVGLSGKFNHMVGVQRAGTILAVNSDPGAPVFSVSDIGIVADWRQAIPVLGAELSAALTSVGL